MTTNNTSTTALPQKMRGTATVYSDLSIEFRPQGEGRAQQVPITSTRNSQLYRTTSAKKPQVVAHLKVPADTADPAAELTQQLNDLCRRAWPEKKQPRPRRRRRLARWPENGTDGVTIEADERKYSLHVAMDISLADHVDYKDFFYQLVNETSKCLAFNTDFMNRLLRAAANTSGK